MRNGTMAVPVTAGRRIMSLTVFLAAWLLAGLAHAQGSGPDPAAPPGSAAGDPRLVGTWVGQTLITSGDASMASEEYLIIRADGSYAYGRGRAVAGGAGWSAQGGGGGPIESGQWRAQDSVLYVIQPDGQWGRVGRYGMTEDGQTMRIIYDRGGRKLWTRR
jgi:hypothetical protein